MEQLITVKTLKQLESLKSYLSDKEYVAFDTETNGVNKDSIIIGYSVCSEVDVAYYVVLHKWDKELGALVANEELVAAAKAFYELLATKKLIMHNAIFDCQMVKNNSDIDLMPSLHTDTMILGHVLDENRSNGLKELGTAIFGDDSRKEQLEMKASVLANGGVLTKDKYELYKADSDLMALYGAKDTILTLKLFYHFVPILIEEGLDVFFYDEESMPLLTGPTYDLNTTGLRVDPDKLQNLRGTLEADCMEAKAFILHEIHEHVKDKYKGDKESNTFNIGASTQLAWLLFIRLGNEFNILTDSGKEVCKALGMRLPYSPAAKREFIARVKEAKGQVYEEAKYNYKTKKMGRPKKVGDVWKYLACGKSSLAGYSKKYKWVERLLQYSKNLKLLNTYVIGIQERMQYNIIRPSFLQHGTTSGRYSSRNPNFQNLPRDDKRVKSCIVSRPGKVFVGADYSQLEPRIFASVSQDKKLLEAFDSGDDFYSSIGAEIFEKFNIPLEKDAEGSFAKLYPELRNIAKVVALSTTYGTTAPKMAISLGKSVEEASDIIEKYLNKFSGVHKFMLESHEQAKAEGRVHNLFGRPRRMPKALDIKEIYGNTPHEELPYEIRNILNLAVNHRVQSTAASTVNRAAIKMHTMFSRLAIDDSLWSQVKIVLQVHDELIIECPEEVGEEVALIVKHCMENAVELPGVKLEAIPKIAKNLGDLK